MVQLQTKRAPTSNPLQPPVYQIDLSLPPKERYKIICQNYRTEIGQLVYLYEEILRQLTSYPNFCNLIAKLLLRRVFSNEETKEMKGISSNTGVSLHHIVAYNTFLDLFSGCSSGGARVSNAGSERNMSGIVHFRGLDWNMEPLRKLIISVEYVKAGEVIARAVTYAGYVGVLTGVRHGLSLSLNYRAAFSSPSSSYQHRWHQLLMLLGFRPSISSHLRKLLISHSSPPTLKNLKTLLSKTPSTPCYLTFCTPDKVMVVEKDLHDQVTETSHNFLTVTNHDRRMESWGQEIWHKITEKISDGSGCNPAEVILGDSMERRMCIEQFWNADSNSCRSSNTTPTSSSVNVTLLPVVVDSDDGNGIQIHKGKDKNQRRQVEVDDIKYWMKSYPICNETTHFTCIMDPSVVDGGKIMWLESYPAP